MRRVAPRRGGGQDCIKSVRLLLARPFTIITRKPTTKNISPTVQFQANVATNGRCLFMGSVRFPLGCKSSLPISFPIWCLESTTSTFRFAQQGLRPVCQRLCAIAGDVSCRCTSSTSLCFWLWLAMGSSLGASFGLSSFSPHCALPPPPLLPPSPLIQGPSFPGVCSPPLRRDRLLSWRDAWR